MSSTATRHPAIGALGFGLECVVIDTERCAIARRTHGSKADPFGVYPRCVVSLPWLRGQKAQRLLDEVHDVAPAAPKQVYAEDSQQTITQVSRTVMLSDVASGVSDAERRSDEVVTR